MILNFWRVEMKVDMGPKAVTARLRRVSQLRRLCLSLGKGVFVLRPEKVPAEEKKNEAESEN